MFGKNKKTSDGSPMTEEELIDTHFLKEMYMRKREVKEVRAKLADIMQKENEDVGNYIELFEIHIYKVDILEKLKLKCMENENSMTKAMCKAIDDLIEKKHREESLEEADVLKLEKVFKELGMDRENNDYSKKIGRRLMGGLGLYG